MATSDKNYLETIHTGLNAALEKSAEALPQDFNKARFMQNCMAMMQDGKTDFSKCEPRSVIRTLLKGSFLGLDFFNRECYAIPYGNQCSFQTDYKGLIKLAKKYANPPVKDIYAKLVRKGDKFEEAVFNGVQSVSFQPEPFNDGEILGAFAVCLYQDGSMIYDVMSKADIENTRQTYSAKNSPAWNNTWGEMAKKTVLRRLCKLITLDFDSIEQVNAYSRGEDFETDIKNDIEERTASIVIDMPEPVEMGEPGGAENSDGGGQLPGQMTLAGVEPGF